LHARKISKTAGTASAKRIHSNLSTIARTIRTFPKTILEQPINPTNLEEISVVGLVRTYKDEGTDIVQINKIPRMSTKMFIEMNSERNNLE
jgi:hypothetical protein